MKSSKMILLLTIFMYPETSVEQKACDYFFANIFRNEYSDYKIIEFDNQTDTTRYWGIVHKCKNWDDKTIGQIVSTTPDKSTVVMAITTDVKIKKRTNNSGLLKIRVWSKIRVGDNYFVLIGAYRKLRFAEYFFIELDREGKVIGTCKQGEII
jgi:hypothetical protein